MKKTTRRFEFFTVGYSEYIHTAVGNPLFTFEYGDDDEDSVINLLVVIRYDSMKLAEHGRTFSCHGKRLFVVSRSGSEYEILVTSYELAKPSVRKEQARPETRRVRTRS